MTKTYRTLETGSFQKNDWKNDFAQGINSLGCTMCQVMTLALATITSISTAVENIDDDFADKLCQKHGYTTGIVLGAEALSILSLTGALFSRCVNPHKMDCPPMVNIGLTGLFTLINTSVLIAYFAACPN